MPTNTRSKATTAANKPAKPARPSDAADTTPSSADAAGPSPEAWAKITEAADAGEPLDARERAVQHWTPDPLRRWWSSMTAWRVRGADRWVQGELRRANEAWTSEILAGSHVPRHALLRALSIEGTKANATSAAKIFESPHLGSLRVLDLGRDLKLARPFFKKLAHATNLPALDTLVYYPLQFGGGEELAAGTHFTALTHLHLRAVVYSRSNPECARDVDALFKAPWISQLETLESSMGRSTGWFRFASIYKPIREHSARLTSLKRLVLHDGSFLEDLVAAPVLDQIEELVLECDRPEMLREFLRAFGKRGMPSLRRLDVSQTRVTSTQKKDWFQPLSESALRAIVEGSAVAKKAAEVVTSPPT